MVAREYDYVRTIDLHMVKEKLPDRPSSAYKGTFGTLLCVCGSKGMSGAAVMSLASAIRCGVGMVRCVLPICIYDIVAKQISEAVFVPVDGTSDGTLSENNTDIILSNTEKSTAILIGCGIGWNKNTKEIVYKIISNCNIPIIIDADGINSISENIDILSHAKAEVILTPHMGEMSRLTGKSVDEIKLNRVGCAKEFAKKHNVTVVLKGENTIIADKNGETYMNRNGNSGMAKGGSGDVLSGMIGSFLAQGLNSLDASICGVYLHGAAGDICARKFSKTSMLPTDIINELPGLFLEIEK